MFGNTPVESIQKWIDYAINHRAWLVLVFHKIDDSRSQYSTSPQQFEQILQCIENPLSVVTVSHVIDEIQSHLELHPNAMPAGRPSLKEAVS